VVLIEELIGFELLVEVLTLPVLFDFTRVDVIDHTTLLSDEEEKQETKTSKIEDHQILIQEGAV
jgi:Zn-dependent membrane protease YugP